jgi:hypothetical protein
VRVGIAVIWLLAIAGCGGHHPDGITVGGPATMSVEATAAGQDAQGTSLKPWRALDDAGIRPCAFIPVDCAGLVHTQCTAAKECLTPPPSACSSEGPRQGCPLICFGYCRPTPQPTEPGGCYVDDDCAPLPGTTCNAPLECLTPPNCDPNDPSCSTLCYGHCEPILPVDEPGGCYVDADCSGQPGTSCTAPWECQKPPICNRPNAGCPLVCYGRCEQR